MQIRERRAYILNAWSSVAVADASSEQLLDLFEQSVKRNKLHYSRDDATRPSIHSANPNKRQQFIIGAITEELLKRDDWCIRCWQEPQSIDEKACQLGQLLFHAKPYSWIGFWSKVGMRDYHVLRYRPQIVKLSGMIKNGSLFDGLNFNCWQKNYRNSLFMPQDVIDQRLAYFDRALSGFSDCFGNKKPTTEFVASLSNYAEYEDGHIKIGMAALHDLKFLNFVAFHEMGHNLQDTEKEDPLFKLNGKFYIPYEAVGSCYEIQLLESQADGIAETINDLSASENPHHFDPVWAEFEAPENNKRFTARN